MAGLLYAELPMRGVLEVAGDDRVAFLQGLVSNDVTRANASQVVFAALLTPQGRYLFDFFIVAIGDALYLDTEGARLADLQRRLAIYKLRSNVTLVDASSRFAVAAGWGAGSLPALGVTKPGDAKPFAGGIAYADPRLAELGLRFLVSSASASEAIERAGFSRAEASAYDRHRLAIGVPDGSRDLGIEKALLLESGFDELNGIDWRKGCYMGQELTARTKYRALTKRRLVPVEIDGPLPPPGSRITIAGAEAGEIRSGLGNRALALLRLDAIADAAKGTPLLAGGARITPQKPGWAKF